MLAQLAVVVYFAVDSEDDFAVVGLEGLASAFGVDDRQALVGEDCIASTVYA